MDIVHDNSWNHLLQISEKLGDKLPTYVREYTPLTKESASTLEDGLFADDRNRLFPIDSPASTWTSALYFAYNKGELPYKSAEFDYVKGRIQKAAELFKVADDIDAAVAVITAAQAEDPMANYGLVYKEGSDMRCEFPMFDAAGVKKASAFFEEYRRKYPADWRRSIAMNIMAKAAEYGVPEEQLSYAVLSEAGYGIPDKRAMMQEILYRAGLAKHAENAVLLANLNIMLSELPVEAVDAELHKVASIIADFDVAEGLDERYGRTVMPPADAVFGINLKEAEAVVKDAVKLHRHIFSATKLATALKPELFDSLLGDDFTAPLKDGKGKLMPAKLAAALSSMAEEDKAALEEYLQNTYE